MKKKFVVIISLCLLFFAGCENPNSTQITTTDKMRLQITDIPSKYDGSLVNITILDDEDNKVAYCGGNFENGSVTTTYVTDESNNYWVGDLSKSYKVSLDFLYDDGPDTIGFYYVDAVLSNILTCGSGTITISASGTTYNER